LFEGLVGGVLMVKMKKPGNMRALTASWEGPYQFVEHTDGKGNFDFEEGCRICILFPFPALASSASLLRSRSPRHHIHHSSM
jgi:hypothetical protein